MKKQIFTLVLLGLLSSVGSCWADVLLLEAQANVSAKGKFTGTNCTTSVAFNNGGAGTVANGWGSTYSTFVGTLKRTSSVSSITIGLSGTTASQIKIGAVSSGSGTRTLSSVKVGDATLTLDDDYTATGSIVGNSSMQNCTIVFTDAVTDGSSVTFTFSGNVQFYYFEITPAASSYTVTYNNNGGSGTISNSTGKDITLSDGTGFTAPSANYVFSGWNTDAHGTGTSYTSEQTGINKNLDLYAVWTQNGTIDDNGGSVDGTYTATYNKASIEITSTPTYADHSVTGYYSAGTGDDLIATSAGALQASTTYTDASKFWTHTGAAPKLYAHWEEEYEITKGNHTNGDFTIEPSAATVGTEISIIATPSSGYSFSSWTILKTSDESDITSSVSLSSPTTASATFTMPAYAVTINATFEESLYTVTYNVNGRGTCTPAKATQESAGASLTLPTPTWDGYTFDGWYNAGTKIGDAGDSYAPTANITLYAKWTDNTEGKIFSYVDGNYGDKFKAFDGAGNTDGWVTADATGKSKTFTHATTGAQFVITKGAWDKKDNAISALAKFKAGDGNSEMKIVVPAGYKATVRIWYSSYGTSKYLKIDGTNQTAPSTKLNDNWNTAEIEENLVAVVAADKDGDVVLTTSGSSDNIYIARVAVTLTHGVKAITAAGWATYCSPYALDLEHATGLTDAYIVKGGNAGVLTLESVKEGTVPANTGLLLKADEGTVTIPIVASGTTVSGNKLVGVTTATEIAAEVGYVLMASPSLGFYKNANAFTLGANTAYLPVGFDESTPDAAPSAFRIVDEVNGATDIQNIEANEKAVKFIENGRILIKKNGIVYDTMGRKIR